MPGTGLPGASEKSTTPEGTPLPLSEPRKSGNPGFIAVLYFPEMEPFVALVDGYLALALLAVAHASSLSYDVPVIIRGKDASAGRTPWVNSEINSARRARRRTSRSMTFPMSPRLVHVCFGPSKRKTLTNSPAASSIKDL